MSKIGRKPIDLPSGVKVQVKGRQVIVEGSKGKLEYQLPQGIILKENEQKIFIERTSETKQARAFQGLVRALVFNMVKGVSEGFKKELEIVGVGYKVELKKESLFLDLGFSHPVEKVIPSDLKVSTPSSTRIVIEGIDKQRVAEFAAQVRRIKPPEPYKGKGIKYAGEQVRKKLGKAMAKG
ncbi:MAG TPA: 50S ribosomal protein L6 [Candidatus Omnitrophica bacterium]|nr:MAG: 50S ribosomal protein L6 [Candidatus Omnitrophota bacterium]RKY42731.1 MAG: 50S ribosomal protein L6 [Candidatus Omnitrophota bacterium]HEC69080.1 50S ribosomal protein L6 [Candidatus Omnitrophota bacterium]